jgi:hypothetical protein
MTVESVNIAVNGAKIVTNLANILQIANIIATISSLNNTFDPINTLANAQVLPILRKNKAIAYHTLISITGTMYITADIVIRP